VPGVWQMAIAPKTTILPKTSAADPSQEDAALILERHLLRQRALRVAKKAAEITREARRLAREAAER